MPRFRSMDEFRSALHALANDSDWSRPAKGLKRLKPAPRTARRNMAKWFRDAEGRERGYDTPEEYEEQVEMFGLWEGDAPAPKKPKKKGKKKGKKKDKKRKERRPRRSELSQEAAPRLAGGPPVGGPPVGRMSAPPAHVEHYVPQRKRRGKPKKVLDPRTGRMRQPERKYTDPWAIIGRSVGGHYYFDPYYRDRPNRVSYEMRFYEMGLTNEDALAILQALQSAGVANDSSWFEKTPAGEAEARSVFAQISGIRI